MPRGVYDRAAAKLKREATEQDSENQEPVVSAPKRVRTQHETLAAQENTVKSESINIASNDGVLGAIKPSDLRNWDEKHTLYVRNNRFIGITHDDRRGGELHLGPKGRGEDSAVLPLEVARHPGFQKMWRGGSISVSDDPAMEHELLLMELREEELRKQKLAEVLGYMEANPAEKDIVASKCVHCGDNIFIPESQLKRSDIPPLCADHLDMAPLFTIERYLDPQSGEEKVRWMTAVLQPVMKEQRVG